MKKRYIVVRINLYSDEVHYFADTRTKRQAMRSIKDSLAQRKCNNNNPYVYAYAIQKVYVNVP